MNIVLILPIIFISISIASACRLVQSSCYKCTMLTPMIKWASGSYARKMSKVDEANFLGIQSYSGFLTVDEEYNSNLFFWFFPKENMENKPWIIWLQGGPGISSMKGLFDLIGPIQIINGKVHPRNVTWAEEYSLLFLDNPVGAGFSFTDDDRGYPNNEDDVGGQMYNFLLQFLQMFPELMNAPLFIAGESYAGKYVPALAIQVHRHRATRPINLRGIMIGNGLIDPRSMMHYSELCKVIGILSDDQIKTLEEMETDIVRMIDLQHMVNAANLFNYTIETIKKQSGISVYNFAKDPDNSAPEFEYFLSNSNVREWIHVGNGSFDYNNQLVYNKMLPDIMNTTKPWLEELLEHYGVLCYSGQMDVILAYSLSKYTYSTLQWSARKKYDDAPRTQMRRIAGGPVIGYKKSGGNFTEVLLRSAGHATMVEQPESTKYMIDDFIDEFKR